MELDIVYNYVNGNDKEWVNRRSRYVLDRNNSECRFRDNRELMYSLRSVEKYAPWIRKIFILMDSRVPEWLNTDNDRIVIVDHQEFMPEQLLPCYNSNVIEAHLAEIPGLSDIFLYANDDMFFGREVSKEFFVEDGKPVVRMVEEGISPTSYYKRALYNSQQMILQRFGRKIDLVPTHCIDVYSKEALKACRTEFSEEYLAADHNRIRMDNDIQRSIYQYYMIIKNQCILKTYKTYAGLPMKIFDVAKTALFASKYLDYEFYKLDGFFVSHKSRLYFARNPRLVCINDSETATEEDRRRYQQLMQKKFPGKSSFEK